MTILSARVTGFIGTALAGELTQHHLDVSVAAFQKTNLLSSNIKQFVVVDFGGHPDLSPSLTSIDCVIHLADRTHELHKSKFSVLDVFRNINTKLTPNLARQALLAKVERFIL